MTGSHSSLLDAARRDRELEGLAGGEVLDVLVVGGGITGAGVALDAASRGLSVALVERRDLAAGTSRWSSKLVHGGVRYLASGKVGVAAESVRERSILAGTVAPHLIRALPFVTPVGDHAAAPAMGAAALMAYSAMDGLRRVSDRSSIFPAPRPIAAEDVAGWVPGVQQDGLRGGVLAWDGQVEDDARLVIAVARTAAQHGAKILTWCEAIDVGPGGALVVDALSGSLVEVRARMVVNATGIWAQALDQEVPLRPSRGSHLVVPASALGHPRGVLGAAVPGHFGRVAFALPQLNGTVILGITDEPTEEIGYEPQASEAEIDFLVDLFSQHLAKGLSRSDILGVYSGLRPLLSQVDPKGGDPQTSDLSRRHAVIAHAEMITITGGKLTTYRRMAQDVVDLLTDRPCLTAELPLVGSQGFARVTADSSGATSSRRSGGSIPARLVHRFGTEARAVAGMAQGDPSLLEPLAAGVPNLGVEVLWGIRAEGALSIEDVLDGRLRLDLVPSWRQVARLPVADLSAGLIAGLGVSQPTC